MIYIYGIYDILTLLQYLHSCLLSLIHRHLKQSDVSMYKHILALMDDEDKVGVSPNRSIPTSIYTRPGGSNISTLSEPDYVGGAEENMGYLHTTYQLMTELESD